MPTDLTTLANDQRRRRAALQDLERYIFTDQWAAGVGWTGPNPVNLDDKVESTVLTLIERKFVSRNILEEVISRHRDGVVGLEPHWTLGTDQPRGLKRLITEAETALTTWWDETGVHEQLQEAVKTLLYAAEDSKRGEPPRFAYSPLRVFIRSASVGEDGTVPRRGSLDEALGDIRVHAAAPYTAGVIRNSDGDAIATRYVYSDDDGDAREEITGVVATLRRYGLEDNLTRFRDEDTVVLVRNNLGGDVIDAAAYDLGGQLLMFEMTREPLVKASSVSLQKLINKAWTMASHNLDVAGFTERTLLNAQMPGHWEDDDGVTTTPELGVRFVPDPLYVGAGATNYFSGIPQVDADGNVRYTTPSIQYRDPVPPEAFTQTYDAAREAIYEEAKQLHVLISGDATASGRSRAQATNDFVASLELTGSQVARATRWVFSTVLALASVLMGEPRRFVALRPTVTPRLAAVQPSSEDVTAAIAKRDAGLISTQTAMSEVGIEDVDAEAKLIATERAEAQARAAASGLPAGGQQDDQDDSEDDDEDEVGDDVQA